MSFSGRPYILDSDRFGFACNYGTPKSMLHHHCSHEMTSLGHAVEPISDTAPFSLKSTTDLSTFLLICSCWLLMSAIAWLNRVWPCVIWAVICMITCDMLGPLACPAAGAGGVLGCCGCCCWATLSRSSGFLKLGSEEPLGSLGDTFQGYGNTFGFAWFSGAGESTSRAEPARHQQLHSHSWVSEPHERKIWAHKSDEHTLSTNSAPFHLLSLKVTKTRI